MNLSVKREPPNIMSINENVSNSIENSTSLLNDSATNTECRLECNCIAARTNFGAATSAQSAVSKEFPSSKWIKLNVGGKVFLTTIWTLVSKEPESMLARMFSQEGAMLPSDQDEQGAYLIDRSPHYFEPILNYLRHGQLILDQNVSLEGVLEEAKFFGLEALVSQLEPQIVQQNQSMDNIPLTRRDVIKALIQTSHLTEIRFQGVNLAGADLRKLDFRSINFKVFFIH